MILWTFFTKSKNYAIPMYGLQYPWSRRAMDKGKIEAMVTKFSEKFAIIMLKKHRKFCRCGLTHLDATPTFKNRPNTYAAPCKFYKIFMLLLTNKFVFLCFPPNFEFSVSYSSSLSGAPWDPSENYLILKSSKVGFC